MKCPSWAYAWMQRVTSDKGPNHDDLCPCCSNTWLTDLVKLAWYTVTRHENRKAAVRRFARAAILHNKRL